MANRLSVEASAYLWRFFSESQKVSPPADSSWDSPLLIISKEISTMEMDRENNKRANRVAHAMDLPDGR